MDYVKTDGILQKLLYAPDGPGLPKQIRNLANPQLTEEGIDYTADYTRIDELPEPFRECPSQKTLLNSLAYQLEGIQGPPGCGKTSLICCIIRSILPKHGLVLVTAVQNRAVEEVAERLHANGIPFFAMASLRNERVGDVAKDNAVEKLIRDDPSVAALHERLRAVVDSHARSTHYSLSPDDIEERYELFEALTKARKAALKKIITSRQVVICTTTEAHKLCDGFYVDVAGAITTVIVDEAGTIPEHRMPILAAVDPDRLILIGT
jgi:hypothetical protein